MGLEKKVVFLLLLLISVIVSCVYVHAPKMLKDKVSLGVNEPTKIDIEQNSSTSFDIVSEKNNEIVSEENSLNNENLEASDSLEVQTSEEQVVENVEESTLQQETLPPEEVVEELANPLLTTNEKYIRQGQEKRIEELSIDAQELQIEINNYIKDNPVIFKRAGYRTTKESDIVIKRIADILTEYPSVIMEIAGHTDAAGKASVNKEISYARAVTVRDKLIDLGVDAQRLIARGYGENIPIVENNSKGYSKINRRVEFNIVGE